MKIVVFIFLSALSLGYSIQESFLPKHGLPPIGPTIKSTKVQFTFIEMPLDHFDPKNNRTWSIKYYWNSQFFKKNGPIFIMLGGEWTITTDWLQYGQMYDIANQTGAYMFYTQHRFYGDSIPANDDINMSVDNLKYLITDQALADVATLIKTFKTFFDFKNSKVVVFGGSYAGNLAFWMRGKYPELIHAAVSSSAPVNAIVNFKKYHLIVKSMLGPDCSQVISSATKQILQLLGTPKGILKLQKDFNMCKPIDVSNVLDMMYFFSHISTHFGNVVQYASCNSIELICDALKKPKNLDNYTRLALYLNQTFYPDCLPNYEELKEHLTDLTANSRNTRQWFYQQCTEFGLFQTSSESIFPYNILSLEMYQTWCKEFFGSSLTSDVTKLGVRRTNLIYGGLNLEASRVISIQGTGDPWYTLGLQSTLNSSSPVIIVNGSSHCQDLYPISTCDSIDLINAKLTVQKYVKQWLNEN